MSRTASPGQIAYEEDCRRCPNYHDGDAEAVAINAGPFWLSYTWTPEPESEAE